MRVTLDTNVLISATFWYGASNEILKKIENKKLNLVLSLDIIKEFSDVLNSKEIQDKIKNKNLEFKYAINKIISISKIVFPKNKINIIKEDPEDNKILECAISSNSDYIITYDKHLLKLKEFKNIKILNPEDFLKIIKR